MSQLCDCRLDVAQLSALFVTNYCLLDRSQREQPNVQKTLHDVTITLSFSYYSILKLVLDVFSLSKEIKKCSLDVSHLPRRRTLHPPSSVAGDTWRAN